MAYSLSPLLKPRFFVNATNKPLVGGKLYTYLAETTTPATTYSNDTGTPNTNPIILDANGECNLYLDDDVSYRLILKDANDVTYFDKDRVSSIGGGDYKVLTFNTIADLRLKIGSSKEPVAQTSGYYAAGDGGGNSFYWDGTSSATDNGGIIIKPTFVVGAGRWISLRTVINPNMFGAKCDGVSNDLSAINAMFNYFGNNAYSLEFIADKIYYISSGVLITLSGENNAIRMINGNGAVIKLANSARNTDVFKISAAANSSIKNITVNDLSIEAASLSVGVVYDPGAIADGATDTTTITVDGAIVGDTCLVNFNSDLLGCTISGTVTSSNTVTVTFTNNTGSAQNIASGTIYVRVADGSVNGFVLESIGSLGYLYKWTLNNIRVLGTSGKGIYINGAVFEGSLNNCFVDKGSTALNGYGLCINAPSSVLNPSSIDVNSFQSRGGLNGILITGTPNIVENINIFGGTTLFSGNEGIFWNSCRGLISGVHVETPNRLSLVSATTSYGIRTSGGSAVIQSCYVIDTTLRTAIAIFSFSSSRKVTLINNNNTSITKLYKLQTSGGGGITVVGNDYDSSTIEEVYASNVSYITDRINAQCFINKTGFYSSSASITPNFQLGCVVNIQDLATNTTINAPINITPVNGMELIVSIKQNSVGGNTVTWDAIFGRTASAVSLTAYSVTILKFVYIQSKWREVSLTVTT